MKSLRYSWTPSAVLAIAKISNDRNELEVATDSSHGFFAITKHSLIARNYLQTWFVIDLIACLPVQYIGLAVEGQGDTAGSNLSIVKTLRLLRLSKMLRLARIKRILAKYDNSMFVQSKVGTFPGNYWVQCGYSIVLSWLL